MAFAINNGKPLLPIITDDVEGVIVESIHAIYNVMASHGTPLPTWDKASSKEWGQAIERAGAALNALKAHRVEAEKAAFAEAVSEVFAPYFDTARADKADFDALPPSLRARLGVVFPTFVRVPLADLAGVFPGVDVASQVKKLTTLGYKVGKEANGSYTVLVNLPTEITGASK